MAIQVTKPPIASARGALHEHVASSPYLQWRQAVSFDPLLLAGMLGTAIFAVALAIGVFRFCVRRYASGNLVVLHA